MWVPVDYSLPGLGKLNMILVQTSLIRRIDDSNNASLTLDKAFTPHPPPSNLKRNSIFKAFLPKTVRLLYDKNNYLN
jgi:hypothetical protein